MTFRRVRLPVWISASVGLLLAACASPTQFADQVIKANLAQESALNQMLLLNVVRAYQRQPLHFTQIGQFRMPVGVGSPTFGLSTPIGPNSQVYGLTASFAVAQGVDTSVLNSQEFYRGITMPLPSSLMIYYLEQGWPQQMVLSLFVREIRGPGMGAAGPALNFPENPREFKRFQDEIAKLSGCHFEAKEGEPRSYGPEYAAQDLDPKGLAALKQADLAVEAADVPPRAPARFQAKKVPKGTSLQVSGPAETCTLPGTSTTKRILFETPRVVDPDAVTFVLRSPEAMIYYLGEIARAGLGERYSGKGPAQSPTRTTGFPKVKYSVLSAQTFGTSEFTLFEIRTTPLDHPGVSVEYEGQTYSLDKASVDDRSMHVLSLLTQVLGLQNKGTDLPMTTNVRLVQ